LKSMFSVASISDSSGKIYPKNPSDVLGAVEWKNSGRSLAELAIAGHGDDSSASILIDVTNSDYAKAEEARERVLSALDDGKHLVSASKVALANYFSEIFDRARKRNVEIGFGATICGGRNAINVAKSIENGEIQSANAVLNASTTLILSMLEENASVSFEEACQEAAKAGVLESDWSIDLDGIDAAAKTAILANVLFPESKFSLKNVTTRGIRDEKARALIQSNRSNSREKTRLIAEIKQGSVSVEPRTIPSDSPLAVKGRFNVVLLNTKNLGEISIRNLGGGVALTSSVIISDLRKIAKKGGFA
ncbi:MAG: hypothetical protein ACREBS_04175, partial [Nitrososphaerales archaeon]